MQRVCDHLHSTTLDLNTIVWKYDTDTITLLHDVTILGAKRQ